MTEISRAWDWVRWLNDFPDHARQVATVEQIQREAIRKTVEYLCPQYTMSDVPQHVIERDVASVTEALVGKKKG